MAQRRPHFVRATTAPLDYEAPVGAAPSNADRGHRIFFVGDNPQIEILEAEPTKPGFIAPPLGLKAAAFTEFSGDGKKVAWLNAADGSLWCSRIDGSDRIELISPPTRIFHMRWSPDGRQIAVVASPPGAPWKVYLIDAEGGQPRMLLAEGWNEADPTWSPDGKTIVFGRLPDRMDSARLIKAIYEVDVATRRVVAIPGSEGLFSPRFSPDGRYIAAVRLDQRALLLFDRTTQHWTTLSTQGTADPVWSHDGRFLYFQDFLAPGKPIYKVAVPTGRIELVSTIDSLRTIPVIDYRLITLAPGDRPVISARTSKVNLYSIQLD